MGIIESQQSMAQYVGEAATRIGNGHSGTIADRLTSNGFGPNNTETVPDEPISHSSNGTQAKEAAPKPLTSFEALVAEVKAARANPRLNASKVYRFQP